MENNGEMQGRTTVWTKPYHLNGVQYKRIDLWAVGGEFCAPAGSVVLLYSTAVTSRIFNFWRFLNFGLYLLIKIILKMNKNVLKLRHVLFF